jgi:hypothetical protein
MKPNRYSKARLQKKLSFAKATESMKINDNLLPYHHFGDKGIKPPQQYESF